MVCVVKNEILFLLQTVFIAGSVLGALALGKEALVALISAIFLVANLFVIKQITLFGFDVTATDVYIIGAVLAFNLLQEFYGKRIAKKTIWISFFISLIFVILSKVHLLYVPNSHDFVHGSFEKILCFLPRIVFASFVAHVFSQYVRLFLYGRLQKLAGGRFLVSRNIVITVVEQLLDTVIFGFIGLYGVVHALTNVFLISFLVKMITIICTVPWLLLVQFIFRSNGRILRDTKAK